MGKVFEKAKPELNDRVLSVMTRYHSRLSDLGVTIETMVVFGPRNKDGIQTGPAIVVRGCEAYACVRITSLEERVAGRGDAIIWIDGDKKKHLTPDTLDALIDHEITHLELVPDHENEKDFCLDDSGRVRLRMRKHDFEVGWFHEVAERHGSSSIEVRQASQLVAMKQTYFPFFDIKNAKRKKDAA